jgi:hypothetical protein
LQNLIEDFDKKFQINREKIFLSSVYLGGYMTTKLITLNTSMRQALRKQYLFDHLINPQLNGQRVEIEKRAHLDIISTILPEVEQWIASNVTVDHSSKMWDFTPEQLKTIEEQNKLKFEDFKDIKTD